MAKLNWNKNKANGATSTYGAVPKGCYKMSVKSSSIKAGDDKEVLTLKVMIEEGPFKGRFVFPRFNLRNPSARAEAISHLLLGNLAESVGIEDLDDTDQLNGQMFFGDVTVIPPKNGFGESNDIVKYYPINKPKDVKEVIKEEMQKDDGLDDFEFEISIPEIDGGIYEKPSTAPAVFEDTVEPESAKVFDCNNSDVSVGTGRRSEPDPLEAFKFDDDIPF